MIVEGGGTESQRRISESPVTPVSLDFVPGVFTVHGVYKVESKEGAVRQSFLHRRYRRVCKSLLLRPQETAELERKTNITVFNLLYYASCHAPPKCCF